MDLTVADILQSKNLAKAKVVAGKKGLTKPVTSVTVGEVPDIADWLEGGEIVLSTLFAVGEKPADQLKFVEKLIKAKASCLLVKPKRFIGKLDPKIIELAEKKNFPLIEVPPKIRWTEIVGQTYQLIIGQHLAFQKRSFNIHRQLLDQVISGGSYDSIAKIAASLISKPVVIEDADYQLLASAKLSKEHKKMLEQFKEVEDKAEELGHSFRLKLDKGKRYPAKVSIPIVVEQNTLGFVSALETSKPLNKLDLIALEHAATITAVEMGKERIKFETEMRLKGDFIDDLIARQFQSSEALLKRANFLGCDLSKGALVLIVDIDDFETLLEKHNYTEEDIQRIRREFFNTANWIVDLEHKSSLVSLKSDSVIVFLTPGDDSENLEEEAFRVAKGLQTGLKSRFEKFTFSVGLSSYYRKPEQIEKAFNEAKVALDINKRLGEKDKISSFREIGTYKLLASFLDSNSDELKNFYKETIESLADYDRKHDSELIKTLETFLKLDENINDAAKALFAHRHTVRYRLERIKEITSLDINKSDDKERLALGLKLSRLLG